MYSVSLAALTVLYRGLGLLQGHSICDVLETQWHWDRFLTQYVSFPVSESFCPLHTHISFICYIYCMLLTADSILKRKTKWFLHLLCSTGDTSNFCLVYIIRIRFSVWICGKRYVILNIHCCFFLQTVTYLPSFALLLVFTHKIWLCPWDSLP